MAALLDVCWKKIKKIFMSLHRKKEVFLTHFKPTLLTSIKEIEELLHFITITQFDGENRQHWEEEKEKVYLN